MMWYFCSVRLWSFWDSGAFTSLLVVQQSILKQWTDKIVSTYYVNQSILQIAFGINYYIMFSIILKEQFVLDWHCSMNFDDFKQNGWPETIKPVAINIG